MEFNSGFKGLIPTFGVLEQWRGDGWPSSNDRIRIWEI